MSSYVSQILPLFFLLVVGFQQAYGTEETAAIIQVEPDEILIGQPATLEIMVDIPDEGTLLWPGRESLEPHGIELLQFGMVDTLESGSGRIQMRQNHRITSWQEGYKPIPPLVFTMITDEDTIQFESKAILLSVKGVEVDMQEVYRDIKPQQSFPRTFREVLPYLIGFMVIAVVLFFLLKHFMNRKKSSEETTIWEKPEVPAHIAAISSLESLRRKELWQKGQIKPYHSELTTILRKYLYKRFQLDAIEMTTSELLHQLPKHVRDKSLLQTFKMIFELADMVKFAKLKPEDQDHESVLEKAIEFVKNTAKVNNDE